MAVPSGAYELKAVVDLFPVFGRIEHISSVEVTVPDEKILARRLRELSSDDPQVRRTAVIDLRYFKKDAERVVPALLECLEDADPTIVRVAVSVLMSYPAEAGKHPDRFLKLLSSEDVSTRSIAAQTLGRTAPKSPEIEDALVQAHAAAAENMKRAFEYALTSYRRRHGETK